MSTPSTIASWPTMTLPTSSRSRPTSREKPRTWSWHVDGWPWSQSSKNAARRTPIWQDHPIRPPLRRSVDAEADVVLGERLEQRARAERLRRRERAPLVEAVGGGAHRALDRGDRREVVAVARR